MGFQQNAGIGCAAEAAGEPTALPSRLQALASGMQPRPTSWSDSVRVDLHLTVDEHETDELVLLGNLTTADTGTDGCGHGSTLGPTPPTEHSRPRPTRLTGG